MISSFIGSVVTSFVLAHVVLWSGAQTVAIGALIGMEIPLVMRALHAREVEEVQRLTQFEHDEVRDVDQIGNRTLAGQRKPNAQRRRSGPHPHSGDALRHVAPDIETFERHAHVGCCRSAGGSRSCSPV